MRQSDFVPTAISRLPDFCMPPLNSTYNYSETLQQLLSGRKLLFQEINLSIEIIHEHYLHGFVSYHKGITEKNGSYFCQRCGNQKRHLFAKHACARCEAECVYCRHCLTMGKVSQCSPLLTWTGTHVHYEKRNRALEWQGTLSQGQQHASEKIIAAVGTAKKLLIWAVCGAGKTEILFEGMNKAIEEGQNVVIATPRSDVVHELTPRIKSVFPQIAVISLFGGSEDRGKQGQLVLATTHQLLRYHDHFDFVVIDEVDAFPFSYDPMLKFAAKQAAKQTATTILLTATPDKKLQKSKDLEIVKIPTRYHGFPLPVPKSKWIGNWRKLLKKERVSDTIMDWLKNEWLLNSKRFYLFLQSPSSIKSFQSFKKRFPYSMAFTLKILIAAKKFKTSAKKSFKY
ncbi:DEAD/DEAH box helicase family protein [Anaerobacillus sp. CMMVII]|uniref:DEAD/DEAH box helicase family protein n=1 Tax=Anaerobacillus sp. CMMVII TaxID=2755588 RepID=UPI0037BE7492